PDWVNALDWGRKAVYQDVFRYCQGLIHLRKSHPAFRLTSAEEIQKHLLFLDMPRDRMVGFSLGEHAGGDPWRKIVVLLNANTEAQLVQLPERDWIVVVNGQQAGTEALREWHDVQVAVPARTALV